MLVIELCHWRRIDMSKKKKKQNQRRAGVDDRDDEILDALEPWDKGAVGKESRHGKKKHKRWQPVIQEEDDDDDVYPDLDRKRSKHNQLDEEIREEIRERLTSLEQDFMLSNLSMRLTGVRAKLDEIGGMLQSGQNRGQAPQQNLAQDLAALEEQHNALKRRLEERSVALRVDADEVQRRLTARDISAVDAMDILESKLGAIQETLHDITDEIDKKADELKEQAVSLFGGIGPGMN
jgi:hypothetical protein